MALKGSRVLVTGGSSGIGAAIVARLAGDGARVVFTGREPARGADVASKTGATFLPADARDEAAIRGSVDQAISALGGLDALVCSAGVILEGPLSETSLEDWQVLLDVNLTAPYLYCVACLPALRAAGGGSIVHISSDAGVWGEQEIAAYSVTKAALITLAQMLAVEAGSSGIRVNAVCPGDTAPGMRNYAQGYVEPAAETPGWLLPPLSRRGQGSDVAGVVAFLLGPDSSFVTGACLLVDGGMRAGYRAWEAASK